MSSAIMYFTPQQIAHLRRVCFVDGSAEALLIELLAVTGMRTDELNNLRRRDFIVEENRVYIHGSKKSADGWKMLGMNRQDNEFMQRLDQMILSGLKPNELVMSLFSKNPGTQSSKKQVRRIWYRLRRKAFGLECRLSVHKLRHSFGMTVQTLTGDIMSTQAALRHKSISSTVRYLHTQNAEAVDEMVAKAYKRAS